MTKIYLAGPMSGIPKFNFPAFFDAAAALRAEGFDVVSPAEIDDTEDHGSAMKSPDGDPTNRVHMNNKTWGDFLARDVKLIADQGIEGIVFLPGWFKSRGARLEATVGLLQKNFKFYEYEPATRKTYEFPTLLVIDILQRNFRADYIRQQNEVAQV